MDNIVVFFLLLSSSYVFAQNGDNPCKDDQVQSASGDCVDALVSRNIYVFAPPEEDNSSDEEETLLPKPKLEYNIVFVRAPSRDQGSEPIVVPPPQQKTIVYVLSEKGEAGEQQIIEVPASPKYKPEVYYVNYAEGENPVLPGGVDLQTALDLESTTEPPVEVVGIQGTNTSSIPVQGGYTYAPPSPSAPAAPTGDAPRAPISDDPQAPTGGAPSAIAGGAPQAPTFGAPQAPTGGAPKALGALQQQHQPNFFFVTPQPGFVVRPGSLGSFQQLGFPGLVNLQLQQQSVI